MDRNDWVFVGVRLIGLALLFSAVQSALTVALLPMTAGSSGLQSFPEHFRFVASGHVPTILGHGLLGALCFLGTPMIDRWLRRKDARSSS